MSSYKKALNGRTRHKLKGERGLLTAKVAMAHDDALELNGKGEHVSEARRYFASMEYVHDLELLGKPHTWLPEQFEHGTTKGTRKNAAE